MDIIEYLSMENKTIEQFEEISYILRDTVLNQRDLLDKLLDIFDYLKVPQEITDELDMHTLAEAANYFTGDNIEFDLENIPTTIELNNRVYSAPKWDEVVLKGRYLSKAFNAIDRKDMASYLLALIFKDEQLTNTEHLDETHIQYKAKLFKKLPYKLYYPYVLFQTEEIIRVNTELLK